VLVTPSASIKQVNKQVEKQKEKAELALRQLSRQEFACETDALKAIERLSNSWKYHQIKEIKYSENQSISKREDQEN